MLSAGRVLQGLSAAILYTAGSALVAETVEHEHLGQAMGWLGWAQTASTIIAPLLGGVVFDRAGYQAVFAMVFAMIGIDSILRFGMIEKRIARKLQNQASSQEEHDSTQNAIIDNRQGMTTAVPATRGKPTLCCVLIEKVHLRRFLGGGKPPKPAIFRLLREPDLLIALGGIFIQTLFLTSFDTVLPLFGQATFHWGPTAAGLSFLPLLIPTLCAPLIGHWSDKYGARWPVTLGFVLAVPGFVCLRFVAHDTFAQKVLLCALLAIDGLAFTLIAIPLSSEVALAVDSKGGSRVYAQAYGLFNVMFGAGLVAGPLLSGYLRDRYGWEILVLVLSCISAVSAVASAALIDRRRRKSLSPSELTPA